MTADDLPTAFASLPAQWRAVLPGWTDAAQRLVVDRVREASGAREIAPADPFRALRLVSPAATRVVIVGQDPYPRPGHADGLAFSAASGKPHSLRRVFDVLAADRPGWQRPTQWKLDGWATQGVLLLNPVLTIEVGRPASHMACGWQALTAQIVAVLAGRTAAPVFLLWGKPARAFFDTACPPGALPPVLLTRHPSHDFKRQFMADGSHFAATGHLVDWHGAFGHGSAEVL